MVTLYHGSYNMFDRFDSGRINKTEYGHGFYAADHGSECLEYLSRAVYGDEKGYVYKFEIPDQTYEDRWLVSHEPATGPKIDRLIDALRKDGRDELADKIAQHPNRDGSQQGPDAPELLTQGQVQHWIGNRADDIALYERAGIDGYRASAYYCAYPHAEYGEFSIQQTFNVSEAEASAELKGLQDRRVRRETEMKVHGELDAAREARTRHIKPFHGTATIGINEGGQAYSVYDAYEDHDKFKAQERVTLKFGPDKDGNWLVRDIERDGAKAERAFNAQNLTSDSIEDRMRIADRVFQPESAEIAGVKYEIGGPAEGRVVDQAAFMQPDTQAALAKMTKNYQNAAWQKIDFTQPQGANPAPSAEATASATVMAAGEGEPQPSRLRL